MRVWAAANLAFGYRVKSGWKGSKSDWPICSWSPERFCVSSGEYSTTWRDPSSCAIQPNQGARGRDPDVVLALFSSLRLQAQCDNALELVAQTPSRMMLSTGLRTMRSSSLSVGISAS
eukprot:scaffold4477_cov417-Prasinococcus_capsulatus_cf.AAC.5